MTVLVQTHNVDILSVDVSVLLLFAALQAVAICMFEIVDVAVCCFLYPPCCLWCSLSLNVVHRSFQMKTFHLGRSFPELLKMMRQQLELCLSSWELGLRSFQWQLRQLL